MLPWNWYASYGRSDSATTGVGRRSRWPGSKPVSVENSPNIAPSPQYAVTLRIVGEARTCRHSATRRPSGPDSRDGSGPRHTFGAGVAYRPREAQQLGTGWTEPARPASRSAVSARTSLSPG